MIISDFSIVLSIASYSDRIVFHVKCYSTGAELLVTINNHAIIFLGGGWGPPSLYMR